jgi:hypothetical protein
MPDLIEWLRGCIEHDRTEAEAGISDNSPSGVLAQCEAYTAILDRVVPSVDEMDDQIEREWGSYEQGSHEVSELLVKLLASTYRGYPGYRDEWRP